MPRGRRLALGRGIARAGFLRITPAPARKAKKRRTVLIDELRDQGDSGTPRLVVCAVR
jgi:hypothetical protein